MAYPVLSTNYGSDPVPITKVNVDRAEDGTGRARSYTADKVRFTLVHEHLSSGDKTTLDAYYSTNRLLSFDYVSIADSVTRTCIFAAPIKHKREFGDFWTATVELEEA